MGRRPSRPRERRAAARRGAGGSSTGIASADWYRTLFGLAGVDATDAPPGLPDASDSLDVWPYVPARPPRRHRDCAGVSGPTRRRTRRPARTVPLRSSSATTSSCASRSSTASRRAHSTRTRPPTTARPGAATAPPRLLIRHPQRPERERRSAPPTRRWRRGVRRSEELDATAIEALKGVGWRGENNATRYCEAADARWGGFWGPDL